MSILGVATPPTSNFPSQPYLIAANIPSQLNGVKQANVDAYNSDITANIALLKGDGLQVYQARPDQTVIATTAAGDMYTGDGTGLHMNDAGHAELAAAFLGAVKLYSAGFNSTYITQTIYPVAPASADTFTTPNYANTYSTLNTIYPGIALQGPKNNGGTPGTAYGLAYTVDLIGGTWLTSFGTQALLGFKWCDYAAGTPLTLDSSLTCATLKRPTSASVILTGSASISSASDSPSTSQAASLPAPNTFAPGINFSIKSNYLVGESFSSNASGYTLDNYIADTVFTGWRWCTFPYAGGLATPSLENKCWMLPYPSSASQALTPTKITNSITPAAATASSCVEQTFTYTGLSTAQGVSVSAPSFMGNHVWIGGARISAGNTLAIDFCADATAGTPPAGNYIAVAY